MSRGDEKQGRCFSVRRFDEHGVVVKRRLEEPLRGERKGTRRISRLSAVTTSSISAVRQERVCRKALWSGQERDFVPITPHCGTSGPADGLPGSDMLCLDQALQPCAFNCSGIAAVRITQRVHQLDIEPVVKTKSLQVQSVSPHSSLALLPNSAHSSRDKRLKPCGRLLRRNRIRT